MDKDNPGAASPVNPAALSPIVRNGQERPAPLTAWFRHTLRRQHSNDRRNFPARWYWRLKVDTIDFNDTYEEADEHVRRWHDPVGTLFYVNHEPPTKELKKFGVERAVGLVTCKMSEVERVRLGALFVDDQSLVTRFQVQAGDLFMFKEELYQVQAFSEDAFFGNSERVAVWKLLASIYRYDSAGFASPVQVPAVSPEVPVWQPATLAL